MYHDDTLTAELPSQGKELCNKSGLLLTGPGGYLAHLGLHKEVIKEGEGEWTRGYAFIRKKGKVPKVSWIYCLLVNLKQKNGTTEL